MDINDIVALANLVPGGKYAALVPFLVFGAKLNIYYLVFVALVLAFRCDQGFRRCRYFSRR